MPQLYYFQRTLSSSEAASKAMRRSDFTIGWICALHDELAASRAMLDEEYDSIDMDGIVGDDNVYSGGSIAGHYVIIACLPAGKSGTEAAAIVAKDMMRTFTSIRFGLMVGIGGGLPTEEHDIRLGDIVVSQPMQEHGGVIQYDFGKVSPGGTFERRGTLNKPPLVLLNAVEKLQATHQMQGHRVFENIQRLRELFPRMGADYMRPGLDQDTLFASECLHSLTMQCETCDRHLEIQRQPRIDVTGQLDDQPRIHYGLIASGNKVIASSAERKRLCTGANILCVEMEAAGLMDSFPCLVVRGICDYADARKSDQWQRYAAAAAAAYAKELIEVIPNLKAKTTVKTATAVSSSGQCSYTRTPLKERYVRSSTAVMDFFKPADLDLCQCLAFTKQQKQCQGTIPAHRKMEISLDVVKWQRAAKVEDKGYLLENIIRDLICPNHHPDSIQRQLDTLVPKYQFQLTEYARKVFVDWLELEKPRQSHRNSQKNFGLKLGTEIKSEQFVEGYVYVFTSECVPGLVKVGSTKSSVAERVKEWRKCYYKPQILCSERFQFPQRMEELVHLQFVANRREVLCWKRECKMKFHDEWFQCEPHRMKAVVEEWKRLTKAAGLYDAKRRILAERWKVQLDRLIGRHDGDFGAETWMCEMSLSIEQQNFQKLSMGSEHTEKLS